MRRIIGKLKDRFNRFVMNVKKAWRKLKYLDRTQFNYYIVTGFIGIFCLFTGTTYSAFTLSKYINSATITIAKLNYSLACGTADTGLSCANNSNSITITVPAGGAGGVDLNITSNNAFTTKYAINKGTTTLGVYYSHELKDNMVGNISSNATIASRLYFKNTGASSATVTITIAGGYIQNTLTSNITEGFYEKDITIRTHLLDVNFANPQSASQFPAENSGYAYYKTECTETASPVWDFDTWNLVINNMSDQVACDVYFKLLPTNTDIEISFLLQDSQGNVTVASTPPTSGYTYVSDSAQCSSGTATWNGTSLETSGVQGKSVCTATFSKN